VDGDGMLDLVAFDHDDVKVVRSSDLPPRDAPKAPTNGRVTSATATTLSIAWDDNSDDERKFIISFDENPSTGNTRTRIKAKDSTTAVIDFLNPDTEYCFSVSAENIFGISTGTRPACGRTNREASPTPTPTPDQQGFKRLDVYNCNSENGEVHLWTLNSQNVWMQHGTAPSMWQGSSCPGTSSPVQVPLPDGQWVWFIAVDPKLPGCAENNPANTFCQRAKLQLFGKANGPILPYTVN